MELVSAIYIAVCCLLLPFYKWRQEYDGRAYPLIGLSVMYGICLLIGGFVLPFNSITIATIAVALWLIASLIWSTHPHSMYELFIWLSYLMLFTASRLVPIELVLFMVFPIGVIFAGIQLYRTSSGIGDKLFIFGNTSHNSAFMLASVMVSIWMANTVGNETVEIVISCFTVLTVFAIIATKSKGAILAMFIALVFVGAATKSTAIISFIIMVVLGVLVWMWFNRKHNWGISGSWRERKLIFLATWEMIKERPLTGHGLQSFRKLMPFNVGKLYKNNVWFKKTIINRYPEYKGDIVFANRAHNDFLETFVEVGLIGFLLFVYFFAQIPLDIYSGGFFIMAMVSCLAFFYIRNTHTSMPFWAVIGSVAGVGTQASGSLLILKAVVFGILVAITMYVLKRFMALAYFTAAVLNPDVGMKLELTQKAIDCDPNQGDYLDYYSYYALTANPPMALYYTFKNLTNYDGNRQIWGLWDMASRILFNMDKIKAARWATKKALYFSPDFNESQQMNNIINTVELILQGKIQEAEARIQEVKANG